MTIEIKKLISALKKKREAEGHSIRGLATIIGISFSTLARIERGAGTPDNNSLIRIIEWLGDEISDSGLSFEDTALVHFRASKNPDSKTMRCLLRVADILISEHAENRINSEQSLNEEQSTFDNQHSIVRSKPELEHLSEWLRSQLKLDETAPLDALKVKINEVEVYVPHDVMGLDTETLSYLTGIGSNDWSAMSVPLNANFDKWAILRNDQHTLPRQRVTYLEECWHILLGHKLTKIAKISDSYGRTYDTNEEHDAYYLASASLLPENAVEKMVAEGKTAIEIAKHFGTSPELVEYRIKRLHLWKDYKGMAVRLVK